MFFLFDITGHSIHKKYGSFAFLFCFCHAKIIEQHYQFNQSRQELVRIKQDAHQHKSTPLYTHITPSKTQKITITFYALAQDCTQDDPLIQESMTFLTEHNHHIRSVVIAAKKEYRRTAQSIQNWYIQQGLHATKCMITTLQHEEKNDVEVTFFLAT